MKVILGWLVNPIVHIVSFMSVVILIGWRVGAESALPDPCPLCVMPHDESKLCATGLRLPKTTQP